MATGDAPDLSLLSLEDDLSCSICLSPFECPVTIPCGHNFCQDCLLATWKDSSYSCPQCRTVFATRPELKKNTVLSAVVETFKARSGKPEAGAGGEEVPQEDVIRCDICMEAQAAQTCLTCMASFCEEHLRPHRDNPVFRLHQLSEPVGDLMELMCPEHHKLMELFCSQHERSICSLCLHQEHKGCSFTSQEEQRARKEAHFRTELKVLDAKIGKNESVLFQMKDVQNKLKDSAVSRKKMVSADYQQMRDLLAREEREALNALDREVETGLTKLRGLSKKFNENVASLSRAKEDLHVLLAQRRTLAFLQASYNLPQAASFDPYAPRINLDSKKVVGSQAFAADLREHLAEVLRPPLEARPPLVRPGERGGFAPGSRSPGSHKETFDGQSGPFNAPRSQSPGSQSRAGQKKSSQKQSKKNEDGVEVGMGRRRNSMDRLTEFGGKDNKGHPAAAEGSNKPDVVFFPVDFSCAEKRSDLLKYGTVLTLDPKTAHKRIVLSEFFTKASVSEEHVKYPDCPERFAACSQVLASKGFSQGRHYWEVRLSSNNFVGIGLTYGSIDRKGPTSRLGRNGQSWCVEWFNVKLSAWHNSCETVLVNPGPKRVGVLLDCDDGTATFYNVSDRAFPFHTFVFPFAEPVHPAFWIFSSGSSISLCKLQA